MDQNLPPEVVPKIFTPKPLSQFDLRYKIISGALVFLILVLLGFNLVLDRYGRFWERTRPSQKAVPTPPPAVDPNFQPTPIPDISWIPSWLDKYPWNPKSQEGATDAYLGVNLQGNFQSLKENKLSLMVNGQVVMLDITKDTVFRARPQNPNLSLPVEQRNQQFQLISMVELKSGNVVEVLIKKTPDQQEVITLVNRLD